jgi:hypothetical protein
VEEKVPKEVSFFFSSSIKIHFSANKRNGHAPLHNTESMFLSPEKSEEG